MKEEGPISIICPLCHNMAEDVRLKGNNGATVNPKNIRLKGKKKGCKKEYIDMEKATIKLNPPCYASFTCEACDADISITSRETLTVEAYDVKGEIEK